MTIIRLLKIFAVLRNTGMLNTFIKGFNPNLKTFNSKNNVEQNFRKTLEVLGLYLSNWGNSFQQEQTLFPKN